LNLSFSVIFSSKNSSIEELFNDFLRKSNKKILSKKFRLFIPTYLLPLFCGGKAKCGLKTILMRLPSQPVIIFIIFTNVEFFKKNQKMNADLFLKLKTKKYG
jgi:hypothetical protein